MYNVILKAKVFFITMILITAGCFFALNCPGNIYAAGSGGWVADWDIFYGLNNDTSVDGSYPDLVDYNGIMYAAWSEGNYGGTHKLRVKKYDSGTNTWISVDGGNGINYNTTIESGWSFKPKMAVFNNELYVAWMEQTSNSSWGLKIHIKKYNSTTDTWTWVDGGLEKGHCITATMSVNVQSPDLEVYNNNLYLTWHENDDVYLAEYGGGSTWTSKGKLNNIGAGFAPSMVVSDELLYITWFEYSTLDYIYKIHVKSYNSVDDAQTFVDGGSNGLNKNPAKGAQNVSIQDYNGILFATWSEMDANSKQQVRVAKYNGGTSWTFVDGNHASNGINYNNAKDAINSRMATYNNELYVVWFEYDTYPKTRKIHAKKYNKDTDVWTSIEANGVTNGGADYGLNADLELYDASYPSVAIINGELYAAWHEQNRSLKTSVKVKKFDPAFSTTQDAADLSNLTVSQGYLNTLYDPGTKSYYVLLDNSVTSIDITATKLKEEATIKIDGTTVNSGQAFTKNLDVGDNLIIISVISDSGAFIKDYFLRINRAVSGNVRRLGTKLDTNIDDFGYYPEGDVTSVPGKSISWVGCIKEDSMLEESRAALKFDLGIINNAVESAALKFHIEDKGDIIGPLWGYTMSNDPIVNIYGSNDDSWGPETWPGNLITTDTNIDVSNTPAAAVGQWMSFDANANSFLDNQIQGDKISSYVLLGSTTGNRLFGFNSAKDSDTSLRPYLEVNYIPAPIATEVSLSGNHKQVTITFNETVLNALADLDSLKAKILISTDGTTFSALGLADSVSIVDGKLVVTFDSALTTATNRIKILSGSIKGPSNNIKLEDLITSVIDASGSVIQTYTVTFDGEGGTVGTASQVKVFGAAYGKASDGISDEPMPVPTKTGYLFDGWYDGDNGTGNLIADETVVATASDHTLHAKWMAATYTVSFDAEGGTVGTASQVKMYGAAYGKASDGISNEPMPVPTKTGYVFDGWCDGDNGTGNLITDETIVATASDHTLHAKWLAESPDAQPTTLYFSNNSSNDIILHFNASGSATNYLVVRKTGSEPSFVPVDGVNYNTGAQGDSEVVYSGTDILAIDNAATPGIEYYYKIYSFNGSGSNANYLTLSPLSGQIRLFEGATDVTANRIDSASATESVSAGFPGVGVNVTFPGGTAGTTLKAYKFTSGAATNFYGVPSKGKGKKLYYNVSSTNPSPGNYTIVLDFSSLAGVDWESFKIMKRKVFSSGWDEVGVDVGIIVSRVTDGVSGKFTLAGLDSFSEFAGFEPAVVRTVTSKDDSGAGTLRQMLADADYGDTIEFDTVSMGSSTITLSTPLVISNAVNITGPTGGIVLDGANSTRIMTLDNSENNSDDKLSVYLENIKIQNGNDPDNYAGGIYATWFNTYLSLVNCVITDNKATGVNVDVYGGVGGITLENSGSYLFVLNSTVAGNQGADSDFGVGGIYSGGVVYCYNSIIAGNTGEVNDAYFDVNNSEAYSYNTLYGDTEYDVNTNENGVKLSGGSDNIFGGNPRFVGSNVNSTNPYTIYGISGCTDTGTNSDFDFVNDIRGTGRTLDKTTGAVGTIDMGAYEYLVGTDYYAPVTFDSQGGSLVNEVKPSVYGGKITAPSEPSKFGFDFAGWFKESQCTNEWDFNTDTVTEEKMLYAKWTPAMAPALQNGLSFSDPAGIDNNGKTKVNVGEASVPGNTFRYLISSDNNEVDTPTIGYDASSWTLVADGDNIAAINGKHIGVAEVNGSNQVVRFSDSVAAVVDEAVTVTALADTDTPIVGASNTITLTAKNSLNQVDTNFNGDKTVTLSGILFAPDNTYGSFNGSVLDENSAVAGQTITVTFTNGVASTELSLNYAGAMTVAINVPEVGVPAANNLTISPVAGTASSMVLTQNIIAPAENGGSFSQQPALVLKDAHGNNCISNNSLQVSASKKDSGTWSITGTTTVTASNGIITFTDLRTSNTARIDNAVIAFNADGLSEVTSNAVTLPAKVLTITFDAESGEVSPLTQQKLYGATYGKGSDGTTDESLPIPSKAGYTFINWFDSDNGTGNSITNTTQVTITENHSLYAKWLKNPTIQVEGQIIEEAAANDGSITDTLIVNLSDGTFVQDLSTGITVGNLPEGLSISVLRNSDTKLTISFAEKAVVHDHENSISNAFVTIDKSKINEAVENVVSQNFSIDFRDPVALTVAKASVYENPPYDTGAITVTQEVYLTNGTFTEDLSTGVSVVNIPEGLTLDVTRNSSAHITIAFNGSAQEHANLNDINNAYVLISKEKITGALADTSSNTFKFNFDDPEPVFSVEKSIIWESAENDGRVSEVQRLTLFYGTIHEDITSDDIKGINLPSGLGISILRVDNTRLDVSFTGKSESHENIDDVQSAYFEIIMNKITPTASTISVTDSVYSNSFSINFIDPYPTYSITYNSNGETFGDLPPAGSYLEGAIATISGNTGNLIKTGYDFSGWNTKEDGTGTTYSQGDSFEIGTSDMVLYAIWTAKNYNVTYLSNGSTSGNQPVDSEPHPYMTQVTVTDKGSLAKTGYSFDCWNTKEDGTGTDYTTGSTFTIGDSNVTLYAKWDIRSFTVSFNSNGGSSIENQSIEYSAKASEPQIPVRNGYTFGGWYIDEILTGSFNFNTVILKDISLYAKWIPLPSVSLGNTVVWEDASNDGKISEGIIVNVLNGAFQEDLTNGVTVNNLPEGFGVFVTRNTDTKITVNFTGSANKHEGKDSITNAIITVDQSCIIGAAGNLTTLTFAMEYLNPYPTVDISNQLLKETQANDGSISDIQEILLSNGTFTAGIEGGITVNNLPDGLSYSVARNSDTKLSVNFLGKATNHVKDVLGINVTISDAVINGTSTDIISPDFGIDFNSNNPALTVEKGTISESVANDGSVVEAQIVELSDGIFASSMADGVTVNNLPKGLGINVVKNSNTKITVKFTGRALSHKNSNDVNDISITISKNKVSGAKDNITTGIFKLDFNDPLMIPVLSLGRTVLTEDAANDGSTTLTQTINLTGGSFAQNLSGGVTVNNLPTGFESNVTRNSDTRFTIKFTGNAASHNASDDVISAYVTVDKNFVNNAVADIYSDNFSFDFIDPYPVAEVLITTVNESGNNDGSISDVQIVKITNGILAANLNSGITVNNLPAGLGIKVSRDNDTQFTISFTGKAIDHGNANDVINAGITIDKSKIIGAIEDTITGSFSFHFNNPAPVLTVASPVLNEDFSNDGKVTETQVITLTNGTFAEDMTGGVIVNNIPYGLGVTVTRNSDTELIISFTGNAVRHYAENSTSAVSVSVNRIKINGAGSDLTSDTFAINFKDQAVISVTPGVASEPSPYTDGSISGQITVSLANGTFVQDMTSGVSIVNIPEGLTFTTTRDSDTQLTLSFSGKASNHTNEGDVQNAYISIVQSKVTGATATLNSNTLKFNFNDSDPFFTVGSRIIKEAASNNGTIIEKQILTLHNGTIAQNLQSSNITINNLPQGLAIGNVTRLNDAQLEIGFSGSAASHTTLNNSLSVNFIVDRNVITPTQDGLILTDDVPSNNFSVLFINPYPRISAVNTVITESNSNDGSITDEQTIELTYGTFFNDMSFGVSINNLPEGLGIVTTRISDTKIKVSFTGKALFHTNTKDTSNVSITIDKDKIVGAPDRLTTNSFKIDFADPSIPGDVTDDLDRLNIIYADGDTQNNVTRALYLTTRGASGNTTITWHSSNEGVIKATGRIIRPGPDEGDKTITLTATVIHNATGTQRTKLFSIKAVKLSNDEAVQSAAKKLTLSEAFKFAEGDAWECITNEFFVIKSGVYDTQISWTSSNTSVISFSEAALNIHASVNRPEGKDKNVIITATINKGFSHITKTFLLVVKNNSVKMESNSSRQVTSRQAEVNVNPEGTVTNESVEILRTVLDNSAKIDTVVISEDKVEALTDTINPQEEDAEKRTVSVVMSQPEDDKADELAIEIPSTSVSAMADRNAILDIRTTEGSIKLAKDAVDELAQNGTDLYFRIVPIKNEDEQKTLQNNIANDNQVKTEAGTKNINPLGIPRKIETNYSGISTKVVLPLTGITIPETNRAAFLDSLRIFIEHSDGTKEFIPGTIIYENIEPYGIEFAITKFSSFQLVRLDEQQETTGTSKSKTYAADELTTDDEFIDLFIDNNLQTSTGKIVRESGIITGISVRNEKIIESIKSQKDETTLRIPVSGATNSISCEMSTLLIDLLASRNCNVSFETSIAIYKIPAKRIAENYIKGSDRIVSLKLSVEQDSEALSRVKDAGINIVGNAVEFRLSINSESEEKLLHGFSRYVNMLIPVTTAKGDGIITGLYIDDGGKATHAPTSIETVNQKQYASIHGLYSGLYVLTENSKSFYDVSNSWGREDINDMASRLVVFGTDNGMYLPQSDVTRAEFAAVITKALGLIGSGNKSTFKDVRENDWYYDVVGITVKYGFISGYNDGTFRPDNKITREEAMIILSKAMEFAGMRIENANPYNVLKAYDDSQDVEDWALSSVAACVRGEIVVGNDNRLSVKDNLTRVQTAAVIRNLLVKSGLISQK